MVITVLKNETMIENGKSFSVESFKVEMSLLDSLPDYTEQIYRSLLRLKADYTLADLSIVFDGEILE